MHLPAGADEDLDALRSFLRHADAHLLVVDAHVAHPQLARHLGDSLYEGLGHAGLYQGERER